MSEAMEKDDRKNIGDHPVLLLFLLYHYCLNEWEDDEKWKQQQQ